MTSSCPLYTSLNFPVLSLSLPCSLVGSEYYHLYPTSTFCYYHFNFAKVRNQSRLDYEVSLIYHPYLHGQDFHPPWWHGHGLLVIDLRFNAWHYVYLIRSFPPQMVLLNACCFRAQPNHLNDECLSSYDYWTLQCLVIYQYFLAPKAHWHHHQHFLTPYLAQM